MLLRESYKMALIALKLAWVSGVSGEKGKNGSEKISSPLAP